MTKKAAGEVLLTVLFTQPIYSPGGGRAPGAVLPRGLRPDGRRHVVQERPHLHGRRQGRCRRNCRGRVIAGRRWSQNSGRAADSKLWIFRAPMGLYDLGCFYDLVLLSHKSEI